MLVAPESDLQRFSTGFPSRHNDPNGKRYLNRHALHGDFPFANYFVDETTPFSHYLTRSGHALEVTLSYHHPQRIHEPDSPQPRLHRACHRIVCCMLPRQSSYPPAAGRARRSHGSSAQQGFAARSTLRVGQDQGRIHLHRFARTSYAADQHPRCAGPALGRLDGERRRKSTKSATYRSHEHRPSHPADQRYPRYRAHGIWPCHPPCASHQPARTRTTGCRHDDCHGGCSGRHTRPERHCPL